MATFSGNAAGYRIDHLANGKIRIVDIDAGDGDTGSHIVGAADSLQFDDRTYQLRVDMDIRVNTTVFRDQAQPAITTLADGSYVITWTGDSLNHGSATGIYSQRYDASGNAIGGETLVTTGVGIDLYPDITALSDGGSLIIWSAYGEAGGLNSIYARRYDAAGNAVGDEILIGQRGSSINVAALEDGGFVVTWSGSEPDGDYLDIYARRYDAAGNAVGGQVRVNTDIVEGQFRCDVTALSDGGYVVTWDSFINNGENFGIRAQRFDAAGNKVGGETLINAAIGQQFAPAVAALSDGGYVITWQAQGGDSEFNIYAQRFDAAGNKVGGEALVNTSIYGHQTDPAIAAMADGGYAIAWASMHSVEIRLQRFDAAGNAVGDETLVNVPAAFKADYDVDVTALADGGLVVTWESRGLDSLLSQICARRFDASGESIATGVVLTGTFADDVINGGFGAQVINGDSGNDILSGGDGADVLFGGANDDTLSGGKGADVLDGGTYNDHLSGGDGNDTLVGHYGEDVLVGGIGRDTLIGGENNDSLTGGNAADKFVFDDELKRISNVDTITDFSSAQGDVIQLFSKTFQRFASVGLEVGEANFVANAGGVAMDSNDFLVYETDTGRLFYDKDGSGTKEKILFAVLGVDTHPALTAADFQII